MPRFDEDTVPKPKDPGQQAPGRKRKPPEPYNPRPTEPVQPTRDEPGRGNPQR